MAWAKSVPTGARFDLSASGVPDGLYPLDLGAVEFCDELVPAQLMSREVADRAQHELIAAVARRYRVEPHCVALTMGAGAAVSHVLMAFIRPGDHVIVERPTYEALRRVPENLGAQVSRLERKFDEDWAVVPERLAQLLTPRTRAVILSNLHNPSGVAIERGAMTAIVDLAARVGALVLVDEVYLDFCFAPDDDRLRPVCTLASNGVGWSSASKCFGASALRAAWVVTADAETARGIRAAADFLHVSMPVASARLAASVLTQAEGFTARAQALAAAGRRVMERWVGAERRVGWVPPAAGVMGLVRLPSLMQDGPFCEHLRQRYETQVVPGGLFEAPGFIRVGFGVDPAVLEQGLANISAALDDLTQPGA